MKKTKAMLGMLVIMTLALIMPVHASARSKAYKAYAKWIKAGAIVKETSYGHTYKTKYTSFCLLHLDNDSVPELVAKRVFNGAIEEYYIQSYKKGKLVSRTINCGVGGVGGFRGTASYIPNKGLIYTCSWGSVNPRTYDTIYKLGKSKFGQKAKGEYDRNWENDKKSKAKWNGKRVNAKTYDSKFKKLFNVEKALEFSDLPCVSAKEMLKLL